MAIQKRYDFVLFFDVCDGNPNGDPDAGNLPRVDPETGQGLVTDVCLKRKVRNFVSIAKAGAAGYDIFIKEKAILNVLIERAHELVGTPSEPELPKEGKGKGAKAVRAGGDKVEAARAKMCELYFDVRTFGAVMSTGSNAGQVRGPVQMTFARSVDPILTLEHAITRMAVATEAEAENQKGDNRTMGRKNTVPYGLYRAHGFVAPALATQTGFSEADLTLFFRALEEMFEHDRSAARGLMSTRALVVFEHDSALGDAPAHTLFDRVGVRRERPAARSFGDYALTLDGRPLAGLRTIVPVSRRTAA
jgi:CRISPR-associated protein Csd2